MSSVICIYGKTEINYLVLATKEKRESMGLILTNKCLTIWVFRTAILHFNMSWSEEYSSDFESIDESFEYYEEVFFSHTLNYLWDALEEGNQVNYTTETVSEDRAIGWFFSSIHTSWHDLKGHTKHTFELKIEEQQRWTYLYEKSLKELYTQKRDLALSFQALRENLIARACSESLVFE